MQHNTKSLDVDASSPGSAGQLGVVTRPQRLVAFPIELRKALQDHGLCRHVDAEGKRLSGEDHTEQARFEKILDCLLERRDQPRMVGTDAHLQGRHPVVVAENVQIFIRQMIGSHFRDLPDLGTLSGVGEPQPRLGETTSRSIAPGATENEVDGRQKSLLVEPLDDICAIWRLEPPTPATLETHHVLNSRVGPPTSLPSGERREQM